MKKFILLFLTIIWLASCKKAEFQNESTMFINDVNVKKNNLILKVINQNDPHTIKMVIQSQPLYTIKISDHIFKIYPLENSYAVQEWMKRNNSPQYQYEITKDEFLNVDKQIKKLLSDEFLD